MRRIQREGTAQLVRNIRDCREAMALEGQSDNPKIRQLRRHIRVYSDELRRRQEEAEAMIKKNLGGASNE